MGQFNVMLGGEVLRVRTYGELVTSIIDPTHIVSERFKTIQPEQGALSPMPAYNKTMTVEQMVDIVSFLERQYELPSPQVVIAQ